MRSVKRVSCCSIVACFFLFAASSAFPATLYVDAANSTGNEDGSPAQPFNTIQEAMDAAVENDTILVAPGIYYGKIQLSKGINLISQAGPRSTILDGLSDYVIDGYYVNTYHDYYINGFTLRGSNALVSLIRTNFVVMENCIFRDAPFGLGLSLGSGFAAKRCVFTNISGTAVHSMYNTPPRFYNVTIDGSSLAFEVISSRVSLYNVSISNVGTAFRPSPYDWGASLIGSDVNLWNCQVVATEPSRVNIANVSYNDPLYVAPPEDYRLQPGSLLIDAGSDVGLPYEGAAPDIGAYEYSDLTLPEKIENLASSFAGAPAEIFRAPGEQLQVALYKKFEAILKIVYVDKGASNADARINVLKGCLAKLQNDILDKTDGDNGGNPANDWIESGPQKSELCNQVLAVIANVQAELAARQ